MHNGECNKEGKHLKKRLRHFGLVPGGGSFSHPSSNKPPKKEDCLGRILEDDQGKQRYIRETGQKRKKWVRKQRLQHSSAIKNHNDIGAGESLGKANVLGS